jgi:hypothetical protein
MKRDWILTGSDDDNSLGEMNVNPHTEDGGNMTVRNVGILLQHYMASQPRRPRRELHHIDNVKSRNRC